MKSHSDRIPLTAAQKARLIFDCVPLLFLMLTLVFCLTILPQIGGPHSLTVALFNGLIILVAAHRASRRIRDLVSGVAVVQGDLLKRLWRLNRRGRTVGPWMGEFEQLGRLIMTRNARRNPPGQRYRVIYSPASQIVWSLEPLH